MKQKSRTGQQITAGRPLAGLTWFGVGGATEFYAEPKSPEELRDVLCWAQDRSKRIRVLGDGANVLISDIGVQGAAPISRT
jgi:UDP-N-acetylmuramate dehydrogenase